MFINQQKQYTLMMGLALYERHRPDLIFYEGGGSGPAEAELLAEQYRGVRPAFGYPACPDHVEKRTLFGLLAVELGVYLTGVQGATLVRGLAALFFVVGVVFVWRSFYTMRIPAAVPNLAR